LSIKKSIWVSFANDVVRMWLDYSLGGGNVAGEGVDATSFTPQDTP
jgi:hypothetical protein